MSKIEHITDTKFHKLLKLVQWGERNVVNSHIDEWQDRSEELLGVISAPADDTLKGHRGWHPCDGRCWELCSWMDLCHGPTPLSQLVTGSYMWHGNPPTYPHSTSCSSTILHYLSQPSYNTHTHMPLPPPTHTHMHLPSSHTHTHTHTCTVFTCEQMSMENCTEHFTLGKRPSLLAKLLLARYPLREGGGAHAPLI